MSLTIHHFILIALVLTPEVEQPQISIISLTLTCQLWRISVFIFIRSIELEWELYLAVCFFSFALKHRILFVSTLKVLNDCSPSCPGTEGGDAIGMNAWLWENLVVLWFNTMCLPWENTVSLGVYYLCYIWCWNEADVEWVWSSYQVVVAPREIVNDAWRAGRSWHLSYFWWVKPHGKLGEAEYFPKVGFLCYLFIQRLGRKISCTAVYRAGVTSASVGFLWLVPIMCCPWFRGLLPISAELTTAASKAAGI